MLEKSPIDQFYRKKPPKPSKRKNSIESKIDKKGIENKIKTLKESIDVLEQRKMSANESIKKILEAQIRAKRNEISKLKNIIES